jgi:hypothetical protein
MAPIKQEQKKVSDNCMEMLFTRTGFNGECMYPDADKTDWQ